ncbi:hypothetical protein ABEB36_010806 [Hypothenemus hampei]|uniref:Uncharacterized protein n=1 Tax=Hypothenemus hampei TaxID=57062 RepID=A0ABD1EHE3_HYPHA
MSKSIYHPSQIRGNVLYNHWNRCFGNTFLSYGYWRTSPSGVRNTGMCFINGGYFRVLVEIMWNNENDIDIFNEDNEIWNGDVNMWDGNNIWSDEENESSYEGNDSGYDDDDERDDAIILN